MSCCQAQAGRGVRSLRPTCCAALHGWHGRVHLFQVESVPCCSSASPCHAVCAMLCRVCCAVLCCAVVVRRCTSLRWSRRSVCAPSSARQTRWVLRCAVLHCAVLWHGSIQSVLTQRGGGCRCPRRGAFKVAAVLCPPTHSHRNQPPNSIPGLCCFHGSCLCRGTFPLMH